jgi:hypothetical protein
MITEYQLALHGTLVGMVETTYRLAVFSRAGGESLDDVVVLLDTVRRVLADRSRP